MSASLVGSEMCIRDSPCTAKHSAILHSATFGGNVLPKAGVYALAVLFAVSYTHLTLPTICSV
eukprot:7408248-Alexandrium_andersonii.AAC.1